MTKTRSTKQALLMSVLALVMCLSMLIGSTMAWFTDSVTSTGNKIQAGTLKLDLLLYDVEEEEYQSIKESKKAIFDYSKWEPGYTDVKLLKIENNGTLALKWYAKFVSTNAVTKLADVIDVYVCPSATELDMPENRNLDGYEKVGTVREFINTIETTTKGVLNGNSYAYLGIALKMQETAGNEYQDLTIGAFDIQILATQATVESDIFGTDYDKDAVYPVANIQDFQAALNEAGDGDVIVFTDDVVGDVTLPQKANTKISIDGNNQKFEGTLLVDGKSATQTTAGVTIKNVNFTSATADACITLGKEGDNNTRYTCNVTIENCTFDAPGKVGVKSYTGGDKNVVIRDCTATANAHSLAQLKGIDGVLIENCEVYSKNGINLNNSDNVTISGCTVDVKGYAVRFGESSGGSGAAETYTIENCTLKSANDGGDATIVLRGTADNSTLTIVNTTIVGTPDITNTATNATVNK